MDFKCYHGSQRADIQLEERPIYLIDDKESAIEWANGYAFGGALQEQDEPTLYTIQVTFNNPLFIKTSDQYDRLMDICNWDDEKYIARSTKKLRRLGNYDGIIFDKEYNYGATYYMPINAKKQCKIIKQENVDKRELEEEYKWSKGMSNNIKESLEKIDNFYLTQNVYDVIRFIKGRKQDTRIVYDSNINYYFFSLALDYTHLQLLEQARKTGLYTVKDMTDYFIENEDSVYFLYYYPTVAELTTSKGFVSEQYPNEYNYDFGTICSYYATNFEEMELYNLLKKDLNEQLAYHGSNAEFDKFDLNKFQRGDYGYGIYLTWNKDYASDYGKVKQYDIPESNELLHWEDPITWQDKSLQEKVAKLIDDIYEIDEDKYDELFENTWNHYNQRGVSCPGSVFYYKLSQLLNLSGKDLAQYLYKYGIKGTESDKGNCYCIFNPDDIKSVMIENEFKSLNAQLEAFLEETSGQQTGKPSASLGDNSNIRRVRPHDSNNIINY